MFKVIATSDGLDVCLLSDKLPNLGLWPGYYLRLPTKHRWYALSVGSAVLLKSNKPRTLERLYQEALIEVDTDGSL